MTRYDRYDRYDGARSAYDVPASGRDFKTAALAVYILYAISLFTALPMVIGVVIAYLSRGEARGTIWHAHFTWMIRTFWVTLILGVIFGLLSTPFTLWIGVPLMAVLWIWTAYRVIRGWMALSDRREPVRY